MKTEFTLIADKFSPDAADFTPEKIAECCKWYEDMLTLKNPRFKDLTAYTQKDYYYRGVIKVAGWQFIAENLVVRVFVCEGGNWRIRYVPTKELAERYIKAFSGPGRIFWFFYDINKVNMIKAE